MDQSEHRTRWPRGQLHRPRIGRKYIRVLTRLTSVGNAASTLDIVSRPGNWPTANLRHVSATCAQYGVGPTLVGMLLEGAAIVLEQIYSKKYLRVRLANGRIAGSISSDEEASDRRRGHLVRVRSHMRQAARRGRGEVRVAAKVYGLVHH